MGKYSPQKKEMWKWGGAWLTGARGQSGVCVWSTARKRETRTPSVSWVASKVRYLSQEHRKATESALGSVVPHLILKHVSAAVES